jgi:thiol-disulfide isomerase/thioredoxin
MPTVAEWQREHANELTVALLSAGDADAVQAEAAEHRLENVLLDPDLAMYEAYQANGTPSAVLVAPDGTIASWLAAGSDWIESLVEQTIRGARAAGLPIGAELPSTRLATLDGGEVDLRDALTKPTVLLFWNPGCGFCRSMHDDILAWGTARPDGAPALVVVSAGEPFAVQAESFASAVLLDPEWTVSGALGADGTPMAVLVDGDGRIGSSPVAGAAAVLELLGVGDLSPA